jgi:hypothetical protein
MSSTLTFGVMFNRETNTAAMHQWSALINNYTKQELLPYEAIING